jgi:pyruvate/2-oxoglutarate dehydrogenase complex dihydrolipoamide dehydrogenase (E3) component
MARSAFDLVVLGSGSAGTGAALSARRAGAKRVAVVERDKIGGDCPNYACVPTKALLFSASRFRIARGSARFGVRASVEFDWSTAMRRKNEIVAQIAEHDERLYADAGIDLVRGDAHFIDELRLEADGRTLRAERVIIATGSEPIVPSVPGLRLAARTSDEIVQMDEAPGHPLVLGGGVVGVEFAQLFRDIDSEVMLIDRGDHLVDSEDAEVTSGLRAYLARSGVDIRMATELVEVTGRDGDFEVRLSDGSHRRVDCCVLAATGRRPRVGALRLERTGVRTRREGIVVDEFLRTTHERIWAAGDVAGHFQYTHVAAYEGSLAGHNAFAAQPVAVDLDGIPRITFTDPPLAGVGIGEAEARRRGLEPIVARASLEGMGRALIEGWSDGLFALVADRRSGRLLGASMWGPNSDAVIHEIAVLVRNRGTVRELQRTIHAYPSYNEILSEVAAELGGKLASRAAA